MDKYALIEKINSIEGLTDEERDALTALLREHKKYGLVWEDKPEDVEERMRDSLPVLQEVKDRAIVSGSPDAPNHILIEGDNLEALTALSYTHSGKIDVIYIDPPYNTGNKDYVYNDSYIDRENAYRHSTWLSFMSKRLKIAKQLLSDRGVIFISIDDNEQAQLKLLCDEVFGESNLIAKFTIASNSAKNNSIFVSVSHEYLICYASNKQHTLDNWNVPKSNIESFKKVANKLLYSGLSEDEIHSELLALVKYPKYYEFDHYTHVDKRGPFRASDLTAPGSKAKYDIIHPTTKKPCKTGIRGWSYSQNELQKLIDNDCILFGKDETVIPQLKNYLSENEMSLPKSILFFDSQSSTKWMKSQGFVFDFPKSVEYIKYIASMFPLKDFIILDFFAGSGTTLHAVMQLNEKDKGHRQCILVQKKENDENNICEEVTYVRNKRVIEGYTTPKGERVEGLTRNNLRYYKTEMLPREQTVSNRRRLMSAATDLLCIKNDLYKEVDEFGGKPLNKRAARCFAEGKRTMLVIYNELTVDAFAEAIRSMDVEERIMIYVFSLNRYPQTDNFCEVLDKVELCALPAAIYDAYRHVLPDREKRKKREE